MYDKQIWNIKKMNLDIIIRNILLEVVLISSQYAACL